MRRRRLLFGGGEVRHGVVHQVLVVVVVNEGWRSLVEPLASAGESDGGTMSRNGGGGEEEGVVVVEDEVRKPSSGYGVEVDVHNWYTTESTDRPSPGPRRNW